MNGMSIIVDIPWLKKPEVCYGCPFLQYVEGEDDSFDFYMCIFDEWKKAYTRTPLSLS